ncbi:3-oxoacyl-ACP synthase III family protein [Granulicella arctica]|uniref:3-oxoacyl-[acyl-carrier-protein] synthase-3 n=1 Tax=Granulicella arctica TaxID=940613 RepID=A0A7Y9PEH8_9BACT|nr:ketoacyl-ACP synthase III [Granulicella arctica]NYF78332.1 3-oxoacyl-[acyl-carrier-protein] synthase-3 [Granulicella arctica]
MAFLRGFGAYLPERVVTNAELAPQLGTEPEWILNVSGIAERRYAAAEDTVASLGTRAALDCLERAGLAASELGMILVSSGSSERFCPGPASLIAASLGLSMTPAIDLPIASAGSLVALAMASRLASSMGHILVVGSEIMSRRVAHTPEGKDTAILFGDGAGACIVSLDKGFAAIADSCIYTDGNMADVLAIQNDLIHMDGAAIIRHVSRKLPQAIATVLERNGIAAQGVDTFLLHQANLNLITRIAKSLEVPAERFFANIQRYGNTSSASMLIAAAEWQQQTTGAIQAPLILAAFGVGLNWGAVLALPPA